MTINNMETIVTTETISTTSVIKKPNVFLNLIYKPDKIEISVKDNDNDIIIINLAKKIHENLIIDSLSVIDYIKYTIVYKFENVKSLKVFNDIVECTDYVYLDIFINAAYTNLLDDCAIILKKIIKDQTDNDNDPIIDNIYF